MPPEKVSSDPSTKDTPPVKGLSGNGALGKDQRDVKGSVKGSGKGRAEEPIEVELREPWLALFLAWLWPGAGHFYQRRYAKAVLFMVCILGTWFFGLSLGGGHVVYASLPKQEPWASMENTGSW